MKGFKPCFRVSFAHSVLKMALWSAFGNPEAIFEFFLANAVSERNLWKDHHFFMFPDTVSKA